MAGNLFLRTSVILLIIGMAGGIYMGAREDFTLAPAHAHLNLVGGFLMFMSGMFYKARPGFLPRVSMIHYWVALAGAILLPLGIGAMATNQPWGLPVVSAGSVLVFVSALILGHAVFKGTKD